MGLNRAQRDENWVNVFAKYILIFSLLQDEHFFSSWALAAVKECKIITLKYTGKTCRLYLLYSSASKDIIL